MKNVLYIRGRAQKDYKNFTVTVAPDNAKWEFVFSAAPPFEKTKALLIPLIALYFCF